MSVVDFTHCQLFSTREDSCIMSCERALTLLRADPALYLETKPAACILPSRLVYYTQMIHFPTTASYCVAAREKKCNKKQKLHSSAATALKKNDARDSPPPPPTPTPTPNPPSCLLISQQAGCTAHAVREEESVLVSPPYVCLRMF